MSILLSGISMGRKDMYFVTRAVLCAVAFAGTFVTALTPSIARAQTVGGSYDWGTGLHFSTNDKSCDVTVYAGLYDSWVSISDGVTNNDYDFVASYAGGTKWDVEGDSSDPVLTPEITEEIISYCYSDYVAGTLVQVGPIANSANQPTYGFGFRSDTGSWVEFTVGPGTLEGESTEETSSTPATAFADNEEEIRAALVDDARRNLNSAMSVNQRLIRDARGRMIETQQALSGCNEDETENDSGVESELDTFKCTPNSVVSHNYVPFDVDGTFALNGTTLSTRGSFFEQTGNFEGTQRRLFFGDFDVQHDSDTGSSTATLTAHVAWEQMISDSTMLGYFIGGELASSNISGAFEGDQDRVALTAGGYAVHQLADQVYFDGFISYGIGRNDLDMKNDVLALTSDYTTRTATVGTALSGVYEYERYEFRPELAFSYGKTWIGNVGFTGRAYGLVDDTLSLDAGNVSIANLTLRPEVVWALDADTVADSRSQLSLAPRAICERMIATTRTENCGGGAELGLSSTSEDGLSNAEIRFVRDRVGSSYRSSFAVNLEHRF